MLQKTTRQAYPTDPIKITVDKIRRFVTFEVEFATVGGSVQSSVSSESRKLLCIQVSLPCSVIRYLSTFTRQVCLLIHYIGLALGTSAWRIVSRRRVVVACRRRRAQSVASTQDNNLQNDPNFVEDKPLQINLRKTSVGYMYSVINLLQIKRKIIIRVGGYLFVITIAASILCMPSIDLVRDLS